MAKVHGEIDEKYIRTDVGRLLFLDFPWFVVVAYTDF